MGCGPPVMPVTSSLAMSTPRKARSVLEVHRTQSATVEWQGWLAHDDAILAIAGVFPESDDATTSYLAWRFGPRSAHTPVPIRAERPLMRVLSGPRSWAPATFLCEGCTHGAPLAQRWGTVRIDGTGLLAAPFAEHIACSGDVTFFETTGGKTVDVVLVDPPRGDGEPSAVPRWLKLHGEGVAEVDSSGWNRHPSPSDPDLAVDSQGRRWLAWTEDSYRSVVVSPMEELGLSPPRILHRVGAKREVSSPRIVRGAREDLVVWREYNGKTKRDTRDSSLFSLPLLPGKPAGKPTRITEDREVMSYDVIDTGQGPVVLWSSGMSTRSMHLTLLRGADAGPEVTLPFPRGEMAAPLGSAVLVLGHDASGLVGQPRRALLAAVVALP
jgi:hypothetical protein